MWVFYFSLELDGVPEQADKAQKATVDWQRLVKASSRESSHEWLPSFSCESRALPQGLPPTRSLVCGAWGVVSKGAVVVSAGQPALPLVMQKEGRASPLVQG